MEKIQQEIICFYDLEKNKVNNIYIKGCLNSKKFYFNYK